MSDSSVPSMTNWRSRVARRGAERGAHRELAVAGLGPCQQQVGEVGAGDEQHEADRRLQHPDRARGAADDLGLHRFHLQRVVLRVEGVHLDAGALAPLRQQRLQLGVGGRRRDARLQPADQVQVVTAAVLAVARIEAERQPDLDVVVHDVELRRHHADHFAAHAVEVHGLANHRPAAERRLPQLVRQDDQRRAVGVGLARSEQPALGRRDPQRGQQVVADRGAAHADRALAGHQVQLAGRERAHRGERLVQLAELEELRRRDPELVEAHGREAAGQEHQLPGLRVRERAQQDAVDDREDRGVGADAQGQREDRDQGEPGGAQQAPGRVADIAQQVVHDPGWTSLVTKRLNGAGRMRRHGREARAPVAGGGRRRLADGRHRVARAVAAPAVDRDRRRRAAPRPGRRRTRCRGCTRWPSAACASPRITPSSRRSRGSTRPPSSPACCRRDTACSATRSTSRRWIRCGPSTPPITRRCRRWRRRTGSCSRRRPSVRCWGGPGKRFLVVSSGSSGSALMLSPTPDAGTILHTEFARPEAWHDKAVAMLGPTPAAGLPNSARNRYATDLLLRIGLPEIRPDVVFVWYSDPDTTAHASGSSDGKTAASLAAVDGEIGRIEDWLRAEGRLVTTNILVTSDHGFVTHTGGFDLPGLVKPFVRTMPDGTPDIVDRRGRDALPHAARRRAASPRWWRRCRAAPAVGAIFAARPAARPRRRIPAAPCRSRASAGSIHERPRSWCRRPGPTGGAGLDRAGSPRRRDVPATAARARTR